MLIYGSCLLTNLTGIRFPVEFFLVATIVQQDGILFTLPSRPTVGQVAEVTGLIHVIILLLKHVMGNAWIFIIKKNFFLQSYHLVIHRSIPWFHSNPHDIPSHHCIPFHNSRQSTRLMYCIIPVRVLRMYQGGRALSVKVVWLLVSVLDEYTLKESWALPWRWFA